MKVLLVEDNERVTRFVTKGLQEAGHTADHADNGRDGLFLAASERYDVIVMDRMLPGNIDGLQIIAALRTSGNRTPILILSALSDVDERIRGLKSGGDDYLTKPFAFGELLARVDVLARRLQGSNTQTTLEVGDLHMDLLSRKAMRGTRARSSPARCCWRTSGIIISTLRPMSWTCTSASCGRRSSRIPNGRCCAP